MAVIKADDELNDKIQTAMRKLEESDEPLGAKLFAIALGDTPNSVFACARFVSENHGGRSYAEYVRIMTECRKYLEDYHYSPKVMKQFDERFGITNVGECDSIPDGERILVFEMQEWLWQIRHSDANNNKNVGDWC